MSCLNALTKRVEPYVYSPQDLILSENSLVTGAFIIVEGAICRSRMKSAVRMIELKVGDVFGERALLDSYKSSHYYAATTFSEVVYLPGASFRHICKLYLTPPEIEEVVDKLTNLTLEKSAAQIKQVKPFVQVRRFSLFGPKKLIMHRSEQKEAAAILSAVSGGLLVKPKSKASVLGDLINSCFHPTSVFRLAWDVLIFCGILFYSISCGLLIQAVLRKNFLSDFTPLLVACYVVDTLFLLDCLFSAFFFAYDEEGKIINDHSKIFVRFCKNPTNTMIALLSFPIDIILGLTLHFTFIPPLRMLKIFHLFRFNFYWEIMEDILLTYGGVAVSFEMSRFTNLYVWLFQLCHWCGCLWVLTAEVSVKIFGYKTSWLIVDKHQGLFALDYSSLAGTTAYWRELYWTVNVMSSIGWPDTLPINAMELISISIMIFFGYLLFTTMVGALSSLMGSFNSTGREFNLKVDKIRQLTKFKSVAKPVETKIVRYYEYIWARYGGVDEAEVLGNLPKSLRAAVADHVLGPLVNRIPFFKSCSELMEQVIVSSFETRIFLEDDALMLYGEVGQDMFIIEKGEVEITNADRSVKYAKLKDGDYLGESCFLEISKRTASAFALYYVDTYFLTRDKFLKVRFFSFYFILFY
jgi:CRP-like cAMP-binding protein